MTAYLYIHSRPLENAQRYDFADCADYSFIESWKMFRQESRQLFVHAASCQMITSEMPAAVIQGTVAINDLMRSDQGLWSLIKKFEIYGRLYASYQEDGRRHPQSSPAPISAYVAFAEVLLRHAMVGDCYQYHSTLLKVMDALCALPVENMANGVARDIVRLIDEERSLIDRLEGNIYGG